MNAPCTVYSQRVMMIQLTPGSPAARIGLRTGDEVVEIESTSTSSLTQQQALDLVNSSADTLLMTVERYFPRRSSHFHSRTGVAT